MLSTGTSVSVRSDEKIGYAVASTMRRRTLRDSAASAPAIRTRYAEKLSYGATSSSSRTGVASSASATRDGSVSGVMPSERYDITSRNAGNNVPAGIPTNWIDRPWARRIVVGVMSTPASAARSA